MLCGDLDRGEDGPLSFGGSKGYSFVSPKNGWINDDDDDGIKDVSVASFDHYYYKNIDLCSELREKILSKVSWNFEKRKGFQNSIIKNWLGWNTEGRGQFYLYLDGKMHQVPLDR